MAQENFLPSLYSYQTPFCISFCHFSSFHIHHSQFLLGTNFFKDQNVKYVDSSKCLLFFNELKENEEMWFDSKMELNSFTMLIK